MYARDTCQVIITYPVHHAHHFDPNPHTLSTISILYAYEDDFSWCVIVNGLLLGWQFAVRMCCSYHDMHSCSG